MDRGGWHRPDGSILAVRPQRWGNPFRVGRPYRLHRPDGTVLAGTVTSARHAVELYESFVLERPDLLQLIRDELGGRDLCCWCPPRAPCHVDVLLRLANDAGDSKTGRDSETPQFRSDL